MEFTNGEDKTLEYGIIISDKIKNYQERISTSLADRYVLSFSKEIQELKKIIISGNLTFIVLMLIHNRIIDKSQNMQDLRLFVSKVAKHDYPVLLSGKIGLRKSAVAKLIHDISKRSAENFIKIDMGAIPDNLAESILFGTSKIDTTRPFNYGLIDSANKGTLFLNEIDKTSLCLQGKLLQLLETKRVRKVGKIIENSINFRLICASNFSLKDMVREGKFRQELYYKLSVQSFYLWELDKRKEDISLLTEYYCKKNNFKITEHAISKLILHNWEGNIRELFNILDRSFIEAQALRIVYPEDIHFD